MKPAPTILIPARSDHVQAKRLLGPTLGTPVGCVVSQQGYNELLSYGARFPCPVAVSPQLPRDAVEWFWLPENFRPFAGLVRG